MAASRQGERHFGEVESLGLTRRHEEIVSTTPVLSGGYTGPSQAPNPGPEATGSEATGRGKKVRKQRGKIEQSVKERICKTRKMGACLRCHNQRAKCEPNEADPENPLLPCKTCDNVNKMSGKTIHNLPCLRGKITTIELYRRGGLPYTTRFSHEMLQDVPGYGEIHTVFMTSGLVRTPVRLEIRLFHPNSTDLLDRHYLHNGVPKKVKLPPFCLVDIKKTSEEFADYINAHAFDGLLEAVKGQNIIIRETFKMIAKQCNALPENVTAKGKGGQNTQEPNKQKELLRAAVRLWFSIRHGIGSSTLCGERPQGMEPIHDPDSYFEGEVPGIPRMIVAQFDSIRHERIYKDLAPHVLRLLEGVFTMKNMEAWFTGYLVTFLFLDLVSSASEDRRRWARDNSEGKRMESRYGPVSGKLARFVQDLHMAGAILLQSWHYYKRMDLWNTGWDDPKKDKPLKSLKLEEVEFLKWTVGEMKLEGRFSALFFLRDSNSDAVEGNKFPKTPSDGCWEHPMFWISQMFTSFSKTDYKWAAPEVFACERPSVGRELDLSA
ncbi:hypothetical protein B0T16DRAFT_323471 [Cercophora newfieldiana]|uniref:Zn(2)-C6 fungal-type domain-containing protein n=1 Tax=Cercophora newfieldiana TaxID=92897 RepID=A0AA39YKT8_9PEZI|nr:hypothetical protein B0T16DRAFT_323471 [Cercophora newfieldiana]